MLELLLKVVAAYLLGSVMGAMVLGPLLGAPDIRREGSGNAGATNALRTRGARFGAMVAAVDVAKGVLAVALIPVIPLPGLESIADPRWVQVLCGVAVVLGHIWPIWHRFQGGKGAATLVGVLAVIEPMVLIPVLGVWVLILVFTGYVGLATVLAALVAPIYAVWETGGDLSSPLVTLTLAMALTVAYTHRGNISRLARGEEHRFERAMIFRRGGSS